MAPSRGGCIFIRARHILLVTLILAAYILCLDGLSQPRHSVRRGSRQEGRKPSRGRLDGKVNKRRHDHGQATKEVIRDEGRHKDAAKKHKVRSSTEQLQEDVPGQDKGDLAGLKLALRASLEEKLHTLGREKPKQGVNDEGDDKDDLECNEAAADDNQRKYGNKSGAKKLRPGSFAALGLTDDIVKGMTQSGYRFPTPVQRKVIPPVMAGFDVVAMARTGSGKTASFLAPMVCRISSFLPRNQESASRRVMGVRGLVLVPTRELALQTFQFFKKYGRFTPLTACLIAGGESLESQFAALATNPEIAIATPGRLLQLLSEVSTFTLHTVQICVLDEADRLFEGNLRSVVLELLTRMDAKERNKPSSQRAVPLSSKDPTKARQMILLSATLPRVVAEFAATKLSHDHVVVRLDTDKFLSPTLRIGFYYVTEQDKMASLLFLIKDIVGGVADLPQAQRERLDAVLLGESVMERGLDQIQREKDIDEAAGDNGEAKQISSARRARKRCMIFCATRHSVELLTQVLAYAGVRVGGVHGNMDQEHRKIELGKFKDRDTAVLVVTDVAARGLDIPLLDYVINYDFPATPKLFVHRCGRVGRAGIVGIAHSFATAGDLPHLLDTCVFLGRSVQQEVRDVVPSGIVLEAADNFLLGILPPARVAFYVRAVQHIFLRDRSLTAQALTARRGFDLYKRTCPKASGNSFDKTKELLASRAHCSAVHVWFRDIAVAFGENIADDDEVKKVRAMLSKWEPHNVSTDLAMDWQKDLWELASPMMNRVKQRKEEERLLTDDAYIAEQIEMEVAQEDPQAMRVTGNASVLYGNATQQTSTLGWVSDAYSRGESVAFAESEGMKMRIRKRRRSGMKPPSLRTRLAAQECFLVTDPDEGQGELEELRDRALGVGSGGAMGEDFAENMIEVTPDDEAGMARQRRGGKRVWDKAKKKYVFEDQLTGQKARELKVIKNEAGGRVRFEKREGDGKVYKRWAASTQMRVQSAGEFENQKLVEKAAGKAVVPLRNGKEATNAASIIAGAKKPTALRIEVRDKKNEAKGSSEQDDNAGSKRQKQKRQRAEALRKRLALKRNDGERPLPAKMQRAMTARTTAVKNTKGLRVGPSPDMKTALDMQKWGMKIGAKRKKRHSNGAKKRR